MILPDVTALRSSLATGEKKEYKCDEYPSEDPLIDVILLIVTGLRSLLSLTEK